MLLETGDEILLLKESCTIVGEIARFFAGPDARAERARKRLERRQKDSAKGKDSAAFYAYLAVDVATLEETLQGVADTWSTTEETCKDAVCCVLHTLEDGYLVKERLVRELDSEDGSGSDGEGGNSQHERPFNYLRYLFAELKTELGDGNAGEADEPARIDWLCQVTNFEHPRGKNREMLLQHLRECRLALRPFASAKPVDISWQADGSKDLEWVDVSEAFLLVEKLHNTLEHWECGCFDVQSHRNAQFAFDLGPPERHQSLTGTMYYPTMDQDTKKCVWKSAPLKYDPTVGARSPAYTTTSVAHDEPVNALSPLCDLLDEIAIQGTGLVSLKASRPQLLHEATDPAVPFDTALKGDGALVDCYNVPQPQNLLRMGGKTRMSLALVLAYAYLHLGGGSWWPYDRKPHLHSPRDVREDIPPSRLVYFSPNFSPRNTKERSRENAGGVLKSFNADMPSLPALGKLLLELFLGRSVSWDDMDREVERAEDEMLGTEMLQAVTACTAMGHDKTFKDGGTIRGVERLRQHFVKAVLLPIQYVLRVGYHIGPQDIFRAPARSGAIELSERPMKRLKPHSPLRMKGPESVQEGFCLHDGDGWEQTSQKRAKSADRYLEDLQRCSRSFFKELPHSKRKIDPVKIAILDTGAHISSEQLETVYDGRVRECRTWLGSDKGGGDCLPGATSDRDGHGTHGTSVLLKATQATDIEVYVGQIFDKRTEKVKQDSILDDLTIRRIENAIRYAVDHWEVDIITMSFGFPKPVPEIAAAIESARRQNVLMLAAASNCGGNQIRSWPAREDDVMCIYAADGDGNKYDKNPTPAINKDNFAVLGDSVEAHWPPANTEDQPRLVRKSGTSTATPICAAIAGIILTALRRSEDGYIDSLESRMQARKRQSYQRKLKALGRASGMASVFNLMVGAEGTRDNYQYIAPWKLFGESDHTGSTRLENILHCIDA